MLALLLTGVLVAAAPPSLVAVQGQRIPVSGDYVDAVDIAHALRLALTAAEVFVETHYVPGAWHVIVVNDEDDSALMAVQSPDGAILLARGVNTGVRRLVFARRIALLAAESMAELLPDSASKTTLLRNPPEPVEESASSSPPSPWHGRVGVGLAGAMHLQKRLLVGGPRAQGTLGWRWLQLHAAVGWWSSIEAGNDQLTVSVEQLHGWLGLGAAGGWGAVDADVALGVAWRVAFVETTGNAATQFDRTHTAAGPTICASVGMDWWDLKPRLFASWTHFPTFPRFFDGDQPLLNLGYGVVAIGVDVALSL